jgi:phospholipid/cholesterol/gamma-HCH transport system ATP-binding protein
VINYQVKNVDIESLRLEDLSFGYPDKDLIFEDVTYDLPTDKIVWISGASGAGKSVILKMLNGFMTPNAGKYLINGQSAGDMSFEEFLPYRLNIGYSFDFGGLINNRTIFQNLLLPLEYHQSRGPVNIAEQVHEFMALFNLLGVGNDRPSGIPGAFRKAACVARAFMLNPQVLLLDDPTTGLRPELRTRLKEVILKKRRDGILRHVFVATDDVEFIKDIADEHLIIKNRKITQEPVVKVAV